MFRALYAPLKHLLDDGKSLYKTSDKIKLQDYALRKILQQIHRERNGSSPAAKGTKAA